MRQFYRLRAKPTTIRRIVAGLASRSKHPHWLWFLVSSWLASVHSQQVHWEDQLAKRLRRRGFEHALHSSRVAAEAKRADVCQRPCWSSEHRRRQQPSLHRDQRLNQLSPWCGGPNPLRVELVHKEEPDRARRDQKDTLCQVHPAIQLHRKINWGAPKTKDQVPGRNSRSQEGVPASVPTIHWGMQAEVRGSFEGARNTGERDEASRMGRARRNRRGEEDIHWWEYEGTWWSASRYQWQ